MACIKDGSLPVEPLLTVADVGRALRVSRPTVYSLIRSGRLRVVKVGRATRITVEDLSRCIAECSSAPQVAS